MIFRQFCIVRFAACSYDVPSACSNASFAFLSDPSVDILPDSYWDFGANSYQPGRVQQSSYTSATACRTSNLEQLRFLDESGAPSPANATWRANCEPQSDSPQNDSSEAGAVAGKFDARTGTCCRASRSNMAAPSPPTRPKKNVDVYRNTVDDLNNICSYGMESDLDNVFTSELHAPHCGYSIYDSASPCFSDNHGEYRQETGFHPSPSQTTCFRLDNKSEAKISAGCGVDFSENATPTLPLQTASTWTANQLYVTPTVSQRAHSTSKVGPQLSNALATGPTRNFVARAISDNNYRQQTGIPNDSQWPSRNAVADEIGRNHSATSSFIAFSGPDFSKHFVSTSPWTRETRSENGAAVTPELSDLAYEMPTSLATSRPRLMASLLSGTIILTTEYLLATFQALQRPVIFL